MDVTATALLQVHMCVCVRVYVRECVCVWLCVATRSLLRRDGNSVTAGVHVSVCEGVYVLACVGLCVCVFLWYGLATISRLLKIIGLFCKRTL